MYWPGHKMTKITTHKPDGMISIMRNTSDGIHPNYTMKILKNRAYGQFGGTSRATTFYWKPWSLIDAGDGVGNCIVLEVNVDVVNWIKEQDTALYAFRESTSWARNVNVAPALFTLLALKFS